MKNIKNIERLYERIFITEDLKDSLYDTIKSTEIKSLRKEDDSVYSIFFNPERDDFESWEFVDTNSYPADNSLIHVITISNRNNEDLWEKFKETEFFTEQDFIETVVAENNLVDGDMERVEMVLKESWE